MSDSRFLVKRRPASPRCASRVHNTSVSLARLTDPVILYLALPVSHTCRGRSAHGTLITRARASVGVILARKGMAGDEVVANQTASAHLMGQRLDTVPASKCVDRFHSEPALPEPTELLHSAVVGELLRLLPQARQLRWLEQVWTIAAFCVSSPSELHIFSSSVLPCARVSFPDGRPLYPPGEDASQSRSSSSAGTAGMAAASVSDAQGDRAPRLFNTPAGIMHSGSAPAQRRVGKDERGYMSSPSATRGASE